MLFATPMRIPKLLLALGCTLSTLATAVFAQTSSLVRLENGRLVYTADSKGNIIPDFSSVGYRKSDVALPNVPVVKTISPVPGDNAAHIRRAIADVAALKEENGFKGAILFKAGTYNIGSTITISESGIVLRGEGDASILYASGTSKYNPIVFSSGGKTEVASTRVAITQGYVPIGAKKITVASGHSFAKDDWVNVRREPTSAWISQIGMDGMGGESWSASNYKVAYERQITKVEGNTLTLDAPVVDVIDKDGGYASGFVVKFTDSRVRNVGIENFKMDSRYSSSTDENHGWRAVVFDDATNGWARNINAYNFGTSAVLVDKGGSFITVENCKMIDPKSQDTGGRRYSFHIDGQRCLVQDCYARNGRHDYVTSGTIPGPNVFLNSRGEESGGDCGAHMKWSTGILWDNVTNDKDMSARNYWTTGGGHGWGGGQLMFWNCKTPHVMMQDPKGDQRNWAIGCVANKIDNSGNHPEALGIVESPGTRIAAIPSLFMAQLLERLDGGGNPQAANPVFSPAGGTYSSAQSVTITSSTSGASIRYTLDGSNPTPTTGTLYSGPVSIAATATLKAIAYASGYDNSAVTSASYTITVPSVAAPTFSPAGGTYSSAQSVTIASSTSGASIRYTLDGSTPTSTAGTLYSGAVTISTSATLKAIAYKSGMSDSAVTSASYTINTAPVGVVLYQNTNFGGTASQLLAKGNYTMAQLASKGVPNDWASSVKMPAGWTVILYSDNNFGGTSWTLTSDTASLSALSPSANDQVSSCKIQ
jgi:hypothetical protein